MKLEVHEVPSPNEVPVDQISETLGLLPGLKAEKRGGGWRCAHCGNYQKDDQGWLVWVPDSVRASDSAEAISDQWPVAKWMADAATAALQGAPVEPEKTT